MKAFLVIAVCTLYQHLFLVDAQSIYYAKDYPGRPSPENEYYQNIYREGARPDEAISRVADRRVYFPSTESQPVWDNADRNRGSNQPIPDKSRPRTTRAPTTAAPINPQMNIHANERPSQKKGKRPDIRRAVDHFSWRVFRGLKLPNDFDNLVLSPIMIQLQLSILQKAAAGQTRRQIQDAIGRINTNEVLQLLKSGSGKSNAQLEIANGIFVDASEHLNQSFVNQAQRAGVDIVPVQFRQDATTRAHINKWASDATHGQIPKLLSDSYDIKYVEMVLASAIYFHSTWKYKFNPIELQPFHAFHAGKMIEKSVPFMQLKADLVWDRIAAGGQITGRFIEIPYENNAYSMVILLPDKQFTLDEFIRAFTLETLDTIWDGLRDTKPEHVTVKMPKFSISSQASILNTLLKLQITDLFTINAKLPYFGLNDDPKVSDILQQAVLKVDENGTTAAAATVSLLIPLSADMNVEEVIVVDRPFLAIIFDKTSEIPIFISKVYNP